MLFCNAPLAGRAFTAPQPDWKAIHTSSCQKPDRVWSPSDSCSCCGRNIGSPSRGLSLQLVLRALIIIGDALVIWCASEHQAGKEFVYWAGATIPVYDATGWVGEGVVGALSEVRRTGLAVCFRSSWEPVFLHLRSRQLVIQQLEDPGLERTSISGVPLEWYPPRRPDTRPP